MLRYSSKLYHDKMKESAASVTLHFTRIELVGSNVQKMEFSSQNAGYTVGKTRYYDSVNRKLHAYGHVLNCS